MVQVPETFGDVCLDAGVAFGVPVLWMITDGLLVIPIMLLLVMDSWGVLELTLLLFLAEGRWADGFLLGEFAILFGEDVGVRVDESRPEGNPRPLPRPRPRPRPRPPRPEGEKPRPVLLISVNVRLGEFLDVEGGFDDDALRLDGGESSRRFLLSTVSSSESTVSTEISLSLGRGVVLASVDGEGKSKGRVDDSSFLISVVSFAINAARAT